MKRERKRNIHNWLITCTTIRYYVYIYRTSGTRKYTCTYIKHQEFKEKSKEQTQKHQDEAKDAALIEEENSNVLSALFFSTSFFFFQKEEDTEVVVEQLKLADQTDMSQSSQLRQWFSKIESYQIRHIYKWIKPYNKHLRGQKRKPGILITIALVNSRSHHTESNKSQTNFTITPLKRHLRGQTHSSGMR